MPTFFIGTYNETNEHINKYLLHVKNKKYTNWSLTEYTEKLIKNDFKHLINNDKLNILTKKEFSKNIELIASNHNMRDRRMGFFHLDTYQSEIITDISNQKSVMITFNLSFVQIGEESNRVNSDDSFEVQYTNGITTINQTAINKKYTLQDAYKKLFKDSLEKLLITINNDISTKATSSLLSSDQLFIIKKFKLGKKSKELALKVFKDKVFAEKILMSLFQESLIKEIRKDKELDNVVLLYPFALNKYIFKNWDEYLIRMKEVSTSSIKDENAEIVIRDIKPTCVEKQYGDRVKFLNGSYIEALLGELKETVTDKTKYQTEKVIKSEALSRIVIPLRDKIKIDALSLENNVIKKAKLNISNTFSGDFVANSLDVIREYEIMNNLRESISKLATKTSKNIKDIVKKRPKVFIYENFCKGI